MKAPKSGVWVSIAAAICWIWVQVGMAKADPTRKEIITKSFISNDAVRFFLQQEMVWDCHCKCVQGPVYKQLVCVTQYIENTCWDNFI